MGCCISKFFKKGPEIGEDHTFYRKFVNQTRDPAEVVLGDDGSHLDSREKYTARNVQHWKKRWDCIWWFWWLRKCSEHFKRSLLSFEASENNSYFDAVICGLMFRLTEENITREQVKTVLGNKFYKDFCKSKELLTRDDSVHSFFKTCSM